MMELVKYFKYKCICSYSTNNKQSYVAHTRHCVLYRYFIKNTGKLCPKPFIRLDGTKPTWNKGLNKYNNESIKRISELNRIKCIDNIKSGKNGLINWNKNPDSHRESYKRQSDTRKYMYLTGKLNINPIKCKRGIGSYILINENKFYLRSTYELIVAIYFYIKGYKFNIESIRVKRIDGKICISDFNIGNRIFEVKPYKYMVNLNTINAFKSSGYNYYIIDCKLVNKLRSKLISKIDNFNELMSNVINEYHSGKFYVLNLNDLKLKL